MSRAALSFGRSGALGGAWLLALFLLAVSVARGQFHLLGAPDDSPLWWALSDAVSPRALREAYRDPQANLERYLKDLESGQAQPLSTERADRPAFYLNARLTPELVPMWYAFDIFAGFRLPREGAQRIAQQLGRNGVSEEGRTVIIEFANEHRAALEATIAHVGPLQVEFQRLQSKAVEHLHADPEATRVVAEASKNGDVSLLAKLGGESEERTRALLEASRRNPLTEMGERSLPLLKPRLSPTDWDGLRRYLLVEVAPRIGARLDDKP
jgi:hypothetical protein